MNGIGVMSRKTEYAAINQAKFTTAIRKAFATITTPYKSITLYTTSLGIADSTLSNSVRNYIRHKDEIDEIYDVSGVEVAGYMRKDYYETYLEGFKLKDEYRLPLKSEKVENEPDKPAETGVSQAIEKSLDQMMHSMAEINQKMDRLTKSLDDIAYALLLVSENTQKLGKPVATLDLDTAALISKDRKPDAAIIKKK